MGFQNLKAQLFLFQPSDPKAQLSFQLLNGLSNLGALLLIALQRLLALKKVPVHRVLTELKNPEKPISNLSGSKPNFCSNQTQKPTGLESP